MTIENRQLIGRYGTQWARNTENIKALRAQGIREQIRKPQALTDRPFGVNLVPPVTPPQGFEAQLEVCLEERVSVVSLFWCDPAPFVERCRAAGVVVMLQVNGRWVIETRHRGKAWEVIVEPDHERRLLVVVTAYPVWE
ncbi:MAG: hypothetical protein HY726_08175 [Candidatus Rokubacteria bacterium]|nr:hypothetical protein [Candidatus Rokubacteria bacterium]